jgi:VanZ family protein
VVFALLASVLVVFGAPYVGEIRGALQSAFPEYYRSIIGGTVTIAVLAATAVAVRTIRRRQQESLSGTRTGLRPWTRYTLIALAVVMAMLYATAVSSSNADIRVVEAFHFVEYGLIAYLYYRVWRGRADAGVVVFPACAALAVGIADEFVQWFVPGRVGEIHDVLINAVAVGCALLFSMAVHPPTSLRLPRERRKRMVVGAAVAGLIVAAAAFVDRVHLSYEIRDETLIFRSQYDAGALTAAAADRAVRWRASPPPAEGFTREDHYLSEGRWHVEHRNTKEREGDMWVAWNENRILERFYAPVLDRGSSRWSPEHVSGVAHAAQTTPRGGYVSDPTGSYPLYLMSRTRFWSWTILLAVGVLLICRGRNQAAGACHR